MEQQSFSVHVMRVQPIAFKSYELAKDFADKMFELTGVRPSYEKVSFNPNDKTF